MEEQREIARYMQAVQFLPSRWQRAAEQLSEHQKVRAEELRLRVGQPMTVLVPEGELWTTREESPQIVSQTDLEQICDIVTGYSRYAVSDTLAQGYLTAQGGFRVGVCGTAVLRDRRNCNLRDISSLTIRIGRERRGLCEPFLHELFEGDMFCSTLIIAPPGGGKTTLLRDMIRCLSDGDHCRLPLRVSVVDERGEIAGMYHGAPQLSIGRHTDVLDGCPKAEGIPILLRAANPQVLAVDEITVREDIIAMSAAANCGVALLATIHAASYEELRRKPFFAQLLKMRVFSRAVVVACDAGIRHYDVIAL